MTKISRFLLVSTDEQAGLNLTLSETTKTGFLMSRPKCYDIFLDFAKTRLDITCTCELSVNSVSVGG